MEGNLLAGRAGLADSRRVRHLLPMTFRAFADATRPGLVLPGPVHPAHLQDTSVAHTLDEVRFDLDAYDLAWQDHLTCVGFPRAVHERTRSGAVSDGFMRDLAAWLRRDIDPDAPAESIPLLLDGLATRSSSPMSQRNAAADLGYTPDTFTLRLARLVRSFAGLWCPQRDDRGRIVQGSQAKLYLSDPIPTGCRAGSTQGATNQT